MPFNSGLPKNTPDSCGLIIVDHGSRRHESNELLERVAAEFKRATGLAIIEPAHMELAEPSISTAFGRCAEQGAQRVIVFPYFLGPGRHWDEDIPRLAAEASARYGGVPFLVTAPFGLDDLMLQLIAKRIEQCMSHASGNRDDCDLCAGTDKCRFRGGDAG